MFKKSIVILSVFIIGLGCGLSAFKHVSGVPTLPQNLELKRSGKWLQNAAEASWFSWSGELYYVYTDRNVLNTTRQMKVVKFSDNSVVSTFGSGYGFQDVLVDGGTLYVYATVANTGSRTIVKYISTDLTTWSNPTTIKTVASNSTIYNVAVTKNTDTSKQVIAYEYIEGSANFAVAFMQSSDTVTWTDTGGGLSGGMLCPDMVYVNGKYYTWVGAQFTTPAKWGTWLNSSTNLSSFTWSRLFAIKPTLEYEDVNTTDTDVFEFGGKVYMLYTVSDQNTYFKLTYATFDGTMTQFVEAQQQPN